MNDLQRVTNHLKRLKANGPEGFEGLVARLLERLTGQRFFLAQSGTQDGRDMSTGGFSGTSIAVEAKRFRSAKSFQRRELLGELLELPEWLDLWVIASTVRLPDQVISALRPRAAERGITVEVLDAPADCLGGLLALCAAHEDIVVAFFGKGTRDSLRHLLAAIRSHPDFSLTLESLRCRFSAGSIGYAQARVASHAYLCSAFEDAGRARVNLGQPINVLENEGRHVVDRRQVLEGLNAWWCGWPEVTKPLVLLGEEGMGKTWALASWLASHLKANSDLPLTFLLPAMEIDTMQALDLISSALVTCTGVRELQFWTRRARAFSQRPAAIRPALLLVLDGINEQPLFEWQTLLESLRVAPWKEQVATVLTCRPNYWNETLATYFQDSFQILALGPYEDDELESAIEKSGLQAASLPSTLEPLLRRPRYFDLTVKHRAALEQGGDVTVDRLLYEDWKDRISRKRRRLFSDQDFRYLLAQLAERHRDHLVSKREILGLLPPGDDLLIGLNELITGGVLVQVSFGRYTTEPRRLQQGLGLLLAEQVRIAALGGEAAMRETIASFLEPQADMDRKVAICRSAVTFAILEPRFPAAARFVLLEQWIGNRNLSREDIESFIAYLPASVDSYLRLVERFWLARRANHKIQSLLVRAFFRWRENPRVQEALVRACEKWLSFVHPGGFIFLGGRKGDRKEKLRREIEERAGHTLESGQRFRLVDELEVTDSDDSLYLSHPALLIASLFPVEPLIPALRRWALSRSVMGFAEEMGSVAWMLRCSGEAGQWPALEEVVAPLLDGPRIAQQAAWRLLWASGLDEAASCRERLPEDLFPPNYYAKAYADDPCKLSWRREDCSMCATRPDLPDRLVALSLAPHALDPEFRIGFNLRPRLQGTLSGLRRDQLSSGRMMTADDIDFRQVEPTLAAFAPDLLAEAYRALVHDLPIRSKENCQVLLDELRHHGRSSRQRGATPVNDKLAERLPI